MRKHKCPRCGKNAFKLDEDWTSASCSKCGFSVNYAKIPFMKDALEMMSVVKRATNLGDLDGK